MKQYEYVCVNLLGVIYITPKAKKKYVKQLELIKKVTNRIRLRGYSIDSYLPEYTGSLFLVIDKKHKKCYWNDSLMIAINYLAYNKQARPIPLDWINTVLDIILEDKTNDRHLDMLKRISTLEWNKKYSNN